MNITVYSSALCPRCRAARHHLMSFQKDYPEMTITVKDVFRHPLAPPMNGIWMIPAMSCENDKIYGLFLSRKKIKNFLESCAKEAK